MEFETFGPGRMVPKSKDSVEFFFRAVEDKLSAERVIAGGLRCVFRRLSGDWVCEPGFLSVTQLLRQLFVVLPVVLVDLVCKLTHVLDFSLVRPHQPLGTRPARFPKPEGYNNYERGCSEEGSNGVPTSSHFSLLCAHFAGIPGNTRRLPPK